MGEIVHGVDEVGPVGEHGVELFAAGGSEAIVATDGAGEGRGFADSDEFFVGESGENGVEGGGGGSEGGGALEALEEFIAVAFAGAECGKGGHFGKAFFELGCPGAIHKKFRWKLYRITYYYELYRKFWEMQ
jgi:hypothetical protein